MLARVLIFVFVFGTFGIWIADAADAHCNNDPTAVCHNVTQP